MVGATTPTEENVACSRETPRACANVLGVVRAIASEAVAYFFDGRSLLEKL
jgi:hypothetical protein